MKKSALSALSPREREVFDLLKVGLTSSEVGKKLKIAVPTVETHRTRINAKLGTGSPVDVVIFALRAGVLTRSMVT